MRTLLVHNPTAGTKGHDKVSITEALQLADFKVDYISSKDDDLKRALKGSFDLVVAAGGDGTVAYVFTHLADRSIPIGILPLGSANNLARSLGIAGTPAELAEQWRAGHLRPFHLMEVSFEDDDAQLCSEGFGIGLMPGLLQRRAKGKKADGAEDIRRGREAFVDLIGEAEPLDLEINIDGKPWKGDLMSIDVLNIPFTGPALPLAHHADPTDKVLDVVGFESSKRDELAAWVKAPQQGKPPARRRRGKRIEIRWRDAAGRVDDQLIKAKSDWRQARFRSDPEPLRIVVPAKHPATRRAS